MKKESMASQTRKSAYIAATAATVLLTICLSFMLMLQYSLNQRAILEATERYMIFESRVGRMIHADIALFQGLGAFLTVNPEADEDGVYHYLRHLLSDDHAYINNIAVIRDTTILWSYPKAPNADTIGIDLAETAEHRNAVLQVKENLAPGFHGPVALVQGGTGFVIRIPVVLQDSGYWGQLGIVLKKDILLEQLSVYAQEVGLDIAIFSGKDADKPFFGLAQAADYPVLRFAMDPSLTGWQAHVSLPQVWQEHLFLFIALATLSLSASAAVGIFVYRYLKNSYRVLHMSINDFLTGLYNRHFLDRFQAIVLANAARNKHKAAIALIDLNRFKQINDTYGHGVGDLVLVEIARILQKVTREGEAAFRLGGDEFLLMLPKVQGTESLEAIKRRLARCIREEFHIPGYAIEVGFSLGYALFPQDGQDMDTLLRVADKRLYREKEKRA